MSGFIKDSEDSGLGGLGGLGTRRTRDSQAFAHRLFQAYFFSQNFYSTNLL